MSRTTTQHVLINLIDKYGIEGLDRLVKMYEENAKLRDVAAAFNVTIERARQWRDLLGKRITKYEPHDSVARAMLDRCVAIPVKKEE